MTHWRQGEEDFRNALILWEQERDKRVRTLAMHYTGTPEGQILVQNPPNYPPNSSAQLGLISKRIAEQVIPADPELEEVEPDGVDWWGGNIWAAGGCIALAFVFLTVVNAPIPAYWGLWLLIISGVSATVGWMISALISSGTIDTRLERAQSRAVAAHQRRQSQLVERLRKRIIEDWVDSIADRLAIPPRLLLQFKAEFMRNLDESVEVWAGRVRAYQLAPTYPPAPQLQGALLTPEGYEEYCAGHLRSRGYVDATVTRYSQDGGIDVHSKELIVQCKHYQGSVGVAVVRETYGVASHYGKSAVIITSGSYTAAAKSEALRFGVALLHLGERDTQLNAVNRHGELLLIKYRNTN